MFWTSRGCQNPHQEVLCALTLLTRLTRRRYSSMRISLNIHWHFHFKMTICLCGWDGCNQFEINNSTVQPSPSPSPKPTPNKPTTKLTPKPKPKPTTPEPTTSLNCYYCAEEGMTCDDHHPGNLMVTEHNDWLFDLFLYLFCIISHCLRQIYIRLFTPSDTIWPLSPMCRTQIMTLAETVSCAQLYC